jgi:glycerophosphoryl diester phosphodiesterase
MRLSLPVIRRCWVLPGLACALVGPRLAADDAAAPPDAGWTVRGHVPLEQFVIQSHRGAGELAPENTLEAFELGWKLGTIPEADLRTTRDGVIVAFHDADFQRTVKNAPPELRQKGVQDVTFAELSQLDVGGWKGERFAGRRVSRMTEVFARMTGRPERRLYLDIKNVDLRQLAAEVRAHQVARQVILASPRPAQIREWKRLVPESETLHWMGGTEAELRARLEALRAENFAGITQIQLHVRPNPDPAGAEPFHLSRAFLRAVGADLRARGILFQTLPWGNPKPAVYGQLLDLGVMSFATDQPDVTLKAVRDYYQRTQPAPAAR